ncbi:carboxypeptidase [Candidatus Anaplasma sp. TIGMIC]|uniref:carboxypeptidase n=1 Tax=Candidatus Anaplasma sp. TIGMIC TaxID=3020713 RepID=UPI00232B0912|nr:carboxypeptidase [Candidatus Anaplasma sp. TIGMIC]MDB1135026.1 carboxypeptidase [Candidatus Anaplasma sp. TIGMIC]
MKHYKFLEQVFVRVRNISDVINELCHGKLGTVDCMDKVCTLQEIRQEIIDSEVVEEAIGIALGNKGQLGDWEVANLHCISRMHKNLKRIPADVQNALTVAKLHCKSSWVSFRDGGESAKGVVKHLADVVKLSSEIASVKAGDIGVGNKYDIMLKLYDGDMDTKRVDEIFTDIGAFFRQFFGEVLEKQGSNKAHAVKPIPCDRQVAFHESLASSIYAGVASTDAQGEERRCLVDGLDADFNVHYDEVGYKTGLKGSLEQIGRALYGVNLPKKWKEQPVGGFAGSIMYEAQGFLMSCHLLHDERFLTFILPALKKLFSLRGKSADLAGIRSYLTEVKHDFLLEKSDEVSSLAHIMLRYALEKELVNGDLAVDDLSDAWMQGMQYYFGKAPDDEREGFLQDDYWVSGVFGYLPSKVLGAIAATQIFASIKGHKVDVLCNVEKGNFSDLISWLSRYIYSHGGRYSSTMILKKITGRRLDSEAYKNHLVSRYLSM